MPPSTSSAATTTSVQVALRIRPPTTQDSNSIPVRFQRSVIQTVSATSVTIESPSNALAGAGAPGAPTSTGSSAPKKQAFTFDQVHGPPTTQYELFESTAKPMITRFVDGFNCTILAYGQTSSGKTFTMTGVDLEADPSDPNNGMGIIPRAVSTIFSCAKQLKEERGGAWSFGIKGSFVEIYNEDLLDLLSTDDSTGGRREVQIREDKDGNIIWGGLREVNVKNTAEVMSLIRKGTSIRRTNETDMNAQSSRSHAIFSLTLIQKKFTGATPPRSSSPLPQAGRSPSRLARPGSILASAVARGGLRPSSALGHAGERSAHGDEDAGEWVTITSKFHFVDLAGSERLKRTAAVGERIKEGISINSGLLALGNVISALGDPSRAKSNTATHIPYRDSKLTRLLQDSLGGNAHTLMIACVSPAEWNAGETTNTLKYANRARNIKNRAVVNEKEDGWDDVERLQNIVIRLRKELKALKERKFPAEAEKDQDVLEGAGKRVLAQFTELQGNYEDLREKYVERTEELGRLRGELGEKHRAGTNGNVSGMAKYEEIVGPVIEEYEKAIATMEAELSLNRAALRHTNEMVEEKEEELSTLNSRHAATELYVEELRARISKLTEREASTEAYVRDLEEKIKAYDETSVSSSESITDLKRELARLKESEAYSAKYIADLEARLSKSDESILILQQNVEQLEQECEKRRNEIDTLQHKLDALQKDGDGWRADLEEREKKVVELEKRMAEWEEKKKEAGEARIRLGNVVEEVVTAKKSLEDLSSNSTSPGASSNDLTAATTPQETIAVVTSKPDEDVSAQYLALQQTHTATLADLSTVSAKYRALREISDLAAQLEEAKLGSPTIAEEEATTDSSAAERPEFPQFRRRTPSNRHRDEPQHNAAGRRLFFRQAASAESLHSRSLSQSVSLSQELSSAHLRKASSSSHASSSHSPSGSHSLHSSPSRPNLSISLSLAVNGQERSTSSLEKEIMRLQEVLKEREAEIHSLEETLKESQAAQMAPQDQAVPPGNQAAIPDAIGLSPKTLNHFDHIKQSMANGNAHTAHSDHASNYSESDESLERLNELMLSMAQKESQHRETVDELNAELTQTKRQLDELTALSRDQALNMSQELEALQRKYAGNLDVLRDRQRLLEEASQHKVALETQLQQIEEAHKVEVERLRQEHEAAIEVKTVEVEDLLSRMKGEHESALDALRNELKTATATLKQARSDHEEAFGKLKTEHDSQLRRQIEEANAILAATHEDHQKAVNKLLVEHTEALRQKEVEASTASQTTEEEYYNALTKLRVDHAEALKKLTADHNATIERLREEHVGELRMAEIARQGSLSESESSRNTAIKELQDEHAAALARKEASFAEEVEGLKASHARVMQAKDDDWTLQMDRLRLEFESSSLKLREEWRKEVDALTSALTGQKEESTSALSKISKDSDAALQSIREQHAAILQELERGHEEDVGKLREEHALALKDAESHAQGELRVLTQKHEDALRQLEVEHNQKVADVRAELAAIQQRHQATLKTIQQESQRALVEHQAVVEALKSSHLQEQQDLRYLLEREHDESYQLQRADLERKHVAEKQALQKDQELLVQELEAHKAAAEEFTMLREQQRIKHESALAEKAASMQEVQERMSLVTSERDGLAAEVTKLRQELEKTRSEQTKLVQEASKRESLVLELERHRSLIADLQENLQKVKDEKDNLQSEKSKQDTLVRDLQAQIARSASPPNVRSPERHLGYPRASGLPPAKLPPPTPPPSVPPPPAPRLNTHINGDSNLSTSSHSSSNMTFSSSKESQPESPATSLGHLPQNAPPDPKLTVKIEQQTKQIEEQEAMIKTLNKQLTHCESDLQAHMDLVNTLETSLGDSEKNLRKARMQATELARERDTLNARIDALRSELSEARNEVASVRRSIVEEKQSLEQRLEEEKKAKERVRQQLDMRMEELQKRKSKFACL
ncbi:Kinesin-like protein KIF21B [Leucoagaricus sp. SymC.cos]|nr:Kinesin-like protein KIF21B [Leucoagaricus sp. SymC.cos]